MERVSTRKVALAEGFSRYFTGKPCSHGHVSPRHVRNGACIECEAKASRARREEHPDYHSNWNKQHREQVRRAKRKYRQKRPAAIAEYLKGWMLKNRSRRAIHHQNRRARMSGARLSSGLVEKLLVLQRGKCACCGRPLGDDYHLDHIMPLAKGGMNEDCNMQLLTKQCNLQKHALHPAEYMRKRGFLI